MTPTARDPCHGSCRRWDGPLGSTSSLGPTSDEAREAGWQGSFQNAHTGTGPVGTSEHPSCSSLCQLRVGITFPCLLLGSAFHRGTTWNALMRDVLVTRNPAFYGAQSLSGTWAASFDDGEECFYFGRRDTNMWVAKRQTVTGS